MCHTRANVKVERQTECNDVLEWSFGPPAAAWAMFPGLHKRRIGKGFAGLREPGYREKAT